MDHLRWYLGYWQDAKTGQSTNGWGDGSRQLVVGQVSIHVERYISDTSFSSYHRRWFWSLAYWHCIYIDQSSDGFGYGSRQLVVMPFPIQENPKTSQYHNFLVGRESQDAVLLWFTDKNWVFVNSPIDSGMGPVNSLLYKFLHTRIGNESHDYVALPRRDQEDLVYWHEPKIGQRTNGFGDGSRQLVVFQVPVYFEIWVWFAFEAYLVGVLRTRTPTWRIRQWMRGSVPSTAYHSNPYTNDKSESFAIIRPGGILQSVFDIGVKLIELVCKRRHERTIPQSAENLLSVFVNFLKSELTDFSQTLVTCHIKQIWTYRKFHCWCDSTKTKNNVTTAYVAIDDPCFDWDATASQIHYEEAD